MFQDHLQTEFKKRGPWITRFTINGKNYGGKYDPSGDKRLDQFFEYFPNAETVLELGSLEGGHTIALAKHSSVKRVLGIEGRARNVEKAKFIRQLYGAVTIEFVTTNLEQTNLLDFGQFDSVFCVGLLYHLPKPWELVEQIARVTQNLFLWTHYAKPERATSVVDGFRGMLFRESGQTDPLSGLSSQSFWPTLESLTNMLKKYGFLNIRLIEDDTKRPCVSLAATKANQLLAGDNKV